MRTVKVRVEGIVQGVGFRYYTYRIAKRYGIKGYVKNMPDGSVEVVAEGKKDKVEELVKWCHKGPPYAHVKNIIRKDERWRGEFDTFEIRF